MFKPIRKTTGLIIVIFTLVQHLGCVDLNLKQPPLKIQRYSLEYPPPATASTGPLDVLLRIERFRSSPLYQNTQMLFSDQPYRRTAYSYHKWYAAPSDLVGYHLVRDLKQSGLFKGVLGAEHQGRATHRLEGNVEEFVERKTTDGHFALLEISILLTNPQQKDVSRQILLQKTYRTTHPCTQPSPEALAAAMSRAMSAASAQIATDVYNTLNK